MQDTIDKLLELAVQFEMGARTSGSVWMTAKTAREAATILREARELLMRQAESA